jgi:hypothetical protein
MLLSEQFGQGQILIYPKQGGATWKYRKPSNLINSITASTQKKTLKNYEFVFTQFQTEFVDREVDSISPDEILSFLAKISFEYLIL